VTEPSELCRDIQMKLPDEIWSLEATERYRRGAVTCADFARMDGHYYVFGVVEVPLAWAREKEPGASFTWGCWAEVSRALHDAYLEAFRTEGASRLAGEGRLANDIPGYEDALGAKVRIVFSGERRPAFTMDPATALGRDQKAGLTLEQHQKLDEILFGDDEEDDEEEDEAQ
jgi:hypothetical protein